jgi:hypothetical protein
LQKKIKKILKILKYVIVKRGFFGISSPFRTLPNFLVIGVKRCGTTTLFEQLSEHPCIEKSAHDNLGFFNNNFELGLNWYKSHFTTNFKKKQIIKKYGKFATYDVTSSYIQYEKTATNISKTLPNIKLILILRNPTSRAYSEYNQNIIDEDESRGFEKLIKEEILQMENEQNNKLKFSLDKINLIKKGIYINQILPWLEIFPKNQILIISTEEFGNKTNETYNKIFKFLELPKYEIRNKQRYRKGNYKKMSNETRELLDHFYEKYNNELFQKIGQKFEW